MKIARTWFGLLLLTSSVAAAAMYDAPLDVRKDGDLVAFTAAPRAELAGDKVKIVFAVSAPTDVEVAILDGKGAVVRHLAAGLLGPHAPEPFQRDSLRQELTWDGRDDAGMASSGSRVPAEPASALNPAAGYLKPFQARVSLGAKPRLDTVVGWDAGTMEPVVALTVGKDGELFVLSSEYFRGGTNLRVFDRNGKYLRTIIPYAAGTPRERLASVGELEIAGERLPIIFNGLSKITYPLTGGMRQQNMVWNPKGYLVMVSALGTMAEHGPPRHLLALHPEGGAPEGVNFVGPKLRSPPGNLGWGAGEGTYGLFDHLAVSPDGQWIYLAVGTYSRFDRTGHGILRMKWSDADAGNFWLGQKEAGSDDAHFNSPEGLAVDAKGNLLVCDWGNNRVMAFTPEGKLFGAFAVNHPHQVAVHPVTGSIYVLTCSQVPKWGRLIEDGVLHKYSPLGAGEPKEQANWSTAGLVVMALDPGASPPKLWVAAKGGCDLRPVTDQGDHFEPGDPITSDRGLKGLTFLAGDPARNRVLLYDGNEKVAVIQVDLATGRKTPFCKGTDMALDRDGNVYVLGGRDNAFYRYDPAGKPLPFPGLGTHKVVTKGYRGYGPNLGIPGIAVGANGDIYVMRTSNYGGVGTYGGRVDVFGPDGKPKKDNLIDGLGYADCGLGVDAAGNVYVASNVKPAGQPFPPAFMGKVPANGWTWWEGSEREIPWRYTYYNPYLFNWGSVFKFGPSGGAFYGFNAAAGAPGNKGYGVPAAVDSVTNAPAGASSYRTAYLQHEIREAGAQWRYAGCGIVPASGDGVMPDPGCVCHNSHLAVDPYGRVYVPDVFRFSVELLDTAGNQIARIGRYGNADSAGTGSKVPAPEIAFAWPAHVSVAAGKVFVADGSNSRISVIAFDHATEAACPLPAN